MFDDSINQDKIIEDLIRDAKKNEHGYIMRSVLDAHAFNRLAKEKMLNYNLIKIDSTNALMYHLTERGWNFESFEKEKELYEVAIKKSKIDLKNSERVYNTYRSTRIMAILSFIFSAILLFLTIARALNIWPYQASAGTTGH